MTFQLPVVVFRENSAKDASWSDKVTKTYTVTGSSDFLERFENLLAQIEHMGGIGHSGIAAISVDGDGADRPTFKPNMEIKGKIVDAGKYPDKYEIVRRK